MPGKARRVASRQAQLGRRRKRQQNRPEDSQAAVAETESAVSADSQTDTRLPALPEYPEPSSPESTEAETAAPVLPVAMSPVADAAETSTPAQRAPDRPSRPRRPSPVAASRAADGDMVLTRGGVRGRRDRLIAQVNIGAEIRRILAMSGTVLAIIIVLGIVL